MSRGKQRRISINCVTCHDEVASISLGGVNLVGLLCFIIGGPIDELHPFTKSSKTGLRSSTDSIALLSGICKVSICVYYFK